MSAFTIEKDWVTKSGFRAVVIMTSMGHRCGYVGLSKDNPLHGIGYSDPANFLPDLPDNEEIGKRGVIPLMCAAGDPDRMKSPDCYFDVHGGITYSGGSADYPVASDLWWFGYDCAHCDDSPSQEYLASKPSYYKTDGTHRTLDYCVGECESLADQIRNATRGQS